MNIYNPKFVRIPFVSTLLAAGLVISSCGIFDTDPLESFRVTPVSAVEVAIEIEADSGDRITIRRDGREVAEFRLQGSDTLFYDTGLEPGTSYIWKVVNQSSRRDRSEDRHHPGCGGDR